MDPESRAFYLFGGVVLLFMGLSLGLDAETHARGAADWPGGGREGPEGRERAVRRLILAYRAGAAALSAAGLYLLVCLRFFPGAFARFEPVALSRAGRLLGGAAVILTGLGLATLRLMDWGSRVRRWSFLGAEDGRGAAASRAAFWSGWIVVASFLVFGAWLVSLPPR